MIFYSQYCLDLLCQCSFVSKERHATCWCCGGSNTINCFSERYDDEPKGTRTDLGQISAQSIDKEEPDLPGIAFRHSGEIAPLLVVHYDGRWMTPQECIARQQAIIDKQAAEIKTVDVPSPEKEVFRCWLEEDVLRCLAVARKG